jgi:hypothetical protein
MPDLVSLRSWNRFTLLNLVDRGADQDLEDIGRQRSSILALAHGGNVDLKEILAKNC